MTSESQAIIDFIEARLAEDEAIAQASIADDQGDDGGLEYEYLTSGRIQRPRFGEPLAMLVTTFAVPRRVLREVAAKRAIIADIVPAMNGADQQINSEWGVGPMDPADYESVALLQLLALPYSGHPDYDQSWSTT